MKQGMQRQRGAALVIVLALLTGALVVGVSGMQGALIDERLAGNYSAATQAQMAAEAGASEAYFNNTIPDEAKLECDEAVDRISRGKLEAKFVVNTYELGKEKNYKVVYHVIECDPLEKKRLIVGQVKSNDMQIENPSIYIASYIYEVDISDSGGAEFSIVSGNKGVDLEGGAKIVGGIKTEGRVKMEGASSVDGDVEAGAEGVKLNGSASVSGGIKTLGDIKFDGDSRVGGKVEAGGEVDVPDWWSDDRINRVEGYGDIGFDKFLSQLPDVKAI
ncbi:MAG: PilX N-terminal domain-containing pilus assembly protein, partial [Halomonas sp.]